MCVSVCLSVYVCNRVVNSMRIELVACELNPIIVLRDNAPVPPGFFQRTYLSYRYICQHKHCNVTFWLGHLSHQTGIHAGQPQKCSENVRCPTSIGINSTMLIKIYSGSLLIRIALI